MLISSVKTNVFVLRQVQREVTYALTEKGLESLPGKEADFLIVIDLGQKTTAWYSASPMVLPFTYNDYFSQWQQMDSVSPGIRGWQRAVCVRLCLCTSAGGACRGVRLGCGSCRGVVFRSRDVPLG